MLQKKFGKRAVSFILLSAMFVGCSHLPETNKKVASSALNVKKIVLDNGLIVLIAPNPKLPIVSYYTLFDVGGRYEIKGTTGATHFLEHLMFKGSKKYGP
ncbi:MAG: insulinase family protein [Bacteriovorax sp.]|nr:insulinase family protein [Bacteriovorax sp.]